MSTPQFKTKAEAEAAGYVVDTCCYPWIAYQGPRFAPTLWSEVPTDTEAEQARYLAVVVKRCNELQAAAVTLAPVHIRLNHHLGAARARVAELEAEREGLRARVAELEALLRRYRTETPPGNQPHMIAHEVDALLSPSPEPTK